MDNTRLITISSGTSRKATSWPVQQLQWSDFCEKLKVPVRSRETLQEYMAFKKAQQDDLKDVGGFVGGTVKDGGRRKSANITGRDLITLDMDSIPTNGTDDVLKRVGSLGCGAAVYSTRKHSDYAPRLRVILPLNRTVTTDEYEPIARKVAQLVGLSFCDPTTFEAGRLMFWPSCSADSKYVCEVYDKPFVDADGILRMYEDWTDCTSWPQIQGADAIEKRNIAKQEDPTQKHGLVGAFCRTYSITAAMEKFIPGMYQETSVPGRYTFTGGSTAGGAVVYDGDLFMYSHHATDPCSGQLVNAFDMVRLHMYGEQDDEAAPGTPVASLPSFRAMKLLAGGDKAITDLLTKEKLEEAKKAFSEEVGGEADEEDSDWIGRLTHDGNGNIEKTINNAAIVLENDPLLKGKFYIDEFAACGKTAGGLPWNKEPESRRWTDTDYANVYRYLETHYGITGREKIDNALTIVSDAQRLNEVKDYLESLKWDGVKRLDTLLPDYLGAEDNAYTRAVMRKSLVAAVTRAIKGSTKYDYMPILTGPQGIGKSTFLSVLGGAWFSDSLTTFEGKDAAELIQGTWINEIGELTALSRQEVNTIKQFLSKTDDIYRAAYGRMTLKYPRRCVFFGTSNDYAFLKDQTGNRRFWPVDVGINDPKKDVWNELPLEVDQIWAEAMMYMRVGEPLYLDKRLEAMAKVEQEEHREAAVKEGIIADFISKKVPANWNSLSIQQRRMYWTNPSVSTEELVDRKHICAAEIWCECFGGDLKYLRRADSAEINNILANMPELEREAPTAYGPYGKQRGFRM